MSGDDHFIRPDNDELGEHEMTDIVEKLRALHPNDLFLDAADEIERLRTQLDQAKDIMAGLISLERGSGEKALAFLEDGE